MVEKFEIKLKSDNNIFTSGETVYGFIDLHLKDSIKAKTIKLTAVGRCHAKWYYSDGKMTHNCEGIDNYLNQDMIVWNGSEFGDSLVAGPHQIPFNFTLPEKCPPSHENKNYGKIEYFCKAEIDRPWRLNSKAEVKFYVMPQVDLNSDPELCRPVVGRIDDNLGVKFFSNGKIDASIELPKSGYIAGEKITPKITITNSSTKEVQKIELSLLQHVLFRAKSSHGKWTIENGNGEPKKWGTSTRNTKKDVICHKTDLKIAPGATGNYSTSLEVSEVVTSFPSSPVIKIEYFLKVKITADGLIGNSVSLKMPITIGTIPVLDMSISDAPPPYEIILEFDE